MVTYDRHPQRYQTIVDLSAEEFKNLKASRVSEKLKDTREKLKKIQREAEDAVSDLDPFTYEEFEKDFILHNSFFHQRKSIKKTATIESYESYGIEYDTQISNFPTRSTGAGHHPGYLYGIRA